MPKGIYKRRKKADRTPASAPGVEPVKTGRRRARQANGEAHFIVDDVGRVSIERAGARVDLDLPDTKRLAAFIDRTKAFRG